MVREEKFTPYLETRGTVDPAIHSSALGMSPINANLGSFASNATPNVIPIGVAMADGQLESGYLIPHSSQAGSASHYWDYRIVNRGTGGAGTTVMGSKTLSAAGAGVAANARGSFTPGSGTAIQVAEGDVIAISYSKTGNGIDVVPHTVQLNFRNR